MLMLREVLEKREESWLKLTEKEHEHRAIVGKLKNELAHMRQAATFNREELEKKSLKYKVNINFNFIVKGVIFLK